MLLADFGTTYAKFIDLAAPHPAPYLEPSKNLSHELRVDMATGHNGKRFSNRYINELTALARGGEHLIKEENFTLLDCGSRDIKFVRYEKGRLADMGWNAECGASMGFTIELLGRYYNIDYEQLPVPEQSFSVTCGVLGMSQIFDEITAGCGEETAVARFVKSIAINAYRFAGEPERIYLSGGLCDNQLFVKSFPGDVISLGRFVLLKGLAVIANKENEWP
ncbi:MAG: ATPase [Proteobacteria bacterium]|nr:ATPase [Pseudomonadota bacterium]MBU1640002.1 ATPase [Pseudomonadota bacterium]